VRCAFWRVPPYWFGVECQALNAALKGPPAGWLPQGYGGGQCAGLLRQTEPCLPTLVGVECQAPNAARKGTPRTGYRRDVGRG